MTGSIKYERAFSNSKAKVIFDKTLELFKETGLAVETGQFQQSMLVDLQNDGPVTIVIDSKSKD